LQSIENAIDFLFVFGLGEIASLPLVQSLNTTI